MLSLHDLPALAAAARAAGAHPGQWRSFRIALYKRQGTVDEALAALPPAAADRLRQEADLAPLALASRRDSARDGATKLAWRTRDGHLIESVILRYRTGRTSVCLSTQVGCAADCAFCATGRMGLRRNLTAGEIVDQVLQAKRLVRPEPRTIRNLVFMGMGEPLHNEAGLHAALDLLRDPLGGGFADRYIVVSTVGVPAAMVRFARRYPGVNLALSLHSVRPAVRARLMPAGRRHSLADLRAALAEVAAIQGRRIMIEYLMFDGITDTPEDLAALTDWLRGLPVHVNLIPFNAVPGAPFPGTPRARREAFGAALKAAGFPVTLRYSLGADIDGACGQLATNTAAGAPPVAVPA